MASRWSFRSSESNAKGFLRRWFGSPERRPLCRSAASLSSPGAAPRRPLHLEALESRVVPSVSVVTDRPDYQPGATALFTASGFDPHATVDFTVVKTSVTPNQVKGDWTVTDGSPADLDPTINGR